MPLPKAPLGQVSGRSLGELFGGVRRREIEVYRASSHRGNSPEEELAYLQRVVEEDGAKAIKFRLGGRMRYDEATTRRDHALIRMTRQAFGDAVTLYADANGSYDVPKALEIGRAMQDHGFRFYEEPVAFDQEYKGTDDLPVSSPTSAIRAEKGMVRVPSGPGLGVVFDPAFVRGAQALTA